MIRGRVAALQQVAPDDAEVVVGDVSELRAALHVSQRIDIGSARLQATVGFDEALVVQCYAGRSAVQRIGVGSAAGSEEQVRAPDHPLALRGRDSQTDAWSVRGNTPGLGLEHYFDAVLYQNLPNSVGDVGILIRKKLRVALNYGDLAAEPAKHLSELETDVAATENDQMLGHIEQLHDRGRIERGHLIDSLQRGPSGAATAVDEHQI